MRTFIIILVVVIVVLIIYGIYMARIKAKSPTEDQINYTGVYTTPTGDSTTTGSTGVHIPPKDDDNILIADHIEGETSANPGVVALAFDLANRPPKGETYKAVNSVQVSGAGIFDGTYKTRPGWFFIDSNGNLGNIIIESTKKGKYKGKFKIKLL